MDDCISQYDMRCFASELISEVYRSYIYTKSFHLPIEVDPPSKMHHFEYSMKYTPIIGEYLFFLCTTLRERFQAVFRVLPVFKINPEFCNPDLNFLHSMLICCELLRKIPSDLVYPIILEYKDCWKVHYLVVCAFITEFTLYCFKKNCFRFACTAKNCILAMHLRFFWDCLKTRQDFDELGVFCESKVKEIRESPLTKIELFIQSSLCGNFELFQAMVTIPIRLCICVHFEISSVFFYNHELQYYNTCELYDKKEKESDSLPNWCLYCGYACVIHLHKLLLFDIAGSDFKPKKWNDFVPVRRLRL